MKVSQTQQRDGVLAQSVEITSSDCLREEASDYEIEVVKRLDELEKTLMRAPDYPEIMAYQKFWAALYANLLDLTGSVKEFIKKDTPIPPKKKLILPGEKKLMLPPNCS